MNQDFSNEIGLVMPAAIASGLCVSFCTLQAPDGNLGPSGAPSGAFVDIAGLIDIPCDLAVTSDARIQATEIKEMKQILSRGFRHCFLTGFYPAAIAGTGMGWRAVVDGPGGVVIYDLIGAEPDSQGTQTRLHLQLVTV